MLVINTLFNLQGLCLLLSTEAALQSSNGRSGYFWHLLDLLSFLIWDPSPEIGGTLEGEMFWITCQRFSQNDPIWRPLRKPLLTIHVFQSQKSKAPLVPWQWHTICVSLFWFICFVHSAHVSYAEKSPSSKSRDLSKAKNNPPHFSYCKTHILHHNVKTFQNNNDFWITNRSGWSSKCSALLKIPSPFNLRRRCLHFSKKFVYEM